MKESRARAGGGVLAAGGAQPRLPGLFPSFDILVQNKSGNFRAERSLFSLDKSRVGWLKRGGIQDKKMSKSYLPRVVYHQVYNIH